MGADYYPVTWARVNLQTTGCLLEDEVLALYRTIRVVGNIDYHTAQESFLGVGKNTDNENEDSFPATSSL